MRTTAVDDSLAWLEQLDTASVHEDLVATELNLQAIEAVGGLSVFDQHRQRSEVIDP